MPVFIPFDTAAATTSANHQVLAINDIVGQVLGAIPRLFREAEAPDMALSGTSLAVSALVLVAVLARNLRPCFACLQSICKRRQEINQAAQPATAIYLGQSTASPAQPKRKSQRQSASFWVNQPNPDLLDV